MATPESMPAAVVTQEQLLAWLLTLRDRVVEQRTHLTDLDSAIGDADHGANLARGFSAVADKLGDEPGETVGAMLKSVGMTLVSSVGGASGPLYGTFFLQLGRAAGDVTELDAGGLGAALRAAYDAVAARGKAEPGDKTMLDALGPGVSAYEESAQAGHSPAEAARAAADAAAEGRDATEPLVARKGRASYLGERSAGHVDPGAASSTILMESLADTLADTLAGAG